MLKVLISGAAGRIGYNLAPLIGRGHAFGPSQKVDLVLLDIPQKETYLKGFAMEMEDCLFPSINSVTVSVNPEEAFQDVDVVSFLAGIPLPKKNSRLDYLVKNKSIYIEQTRCLDKYAKKDVKVLVAANPANTLAFIVSEFSKNISKKNITCLMRLDHNRAARMVSDKFNVSYSAISNLVIFGNHSHTQYPYTKSIRLRNLSDGFSVDDQSWVKNHLIPDVRDRAFKVGSSLGYPSVMSPAIAICDHLKDWFFGTKGEEFVTMGVVSDGSYDVPEGLVFGMPVKCNGNFTYDIVKDIKLTDEDKEYLKISIDELLKEKEMVFNDKLN